MIPIIIHEKVETVTPATLKFIERYINADYIFEIENRGNVEDGSIIYLSLKRLAMTGKGVGVENYISYEITERAEDIIKLIKDSNAGVK